MDRLEFERDEGFTEEYEAFVRSLTNPNGSHNSAYDMDKERAMLPQDRLVRVWGWLHGTTGFVSMFRWASGRQDAHVTLDIPEPTAEAIARRKEEIEFYKQSCKECTYAA